MKNLPVILCLLLICCLACGEQPSDATEAKQQPAKERFSGQRTKDGVDYAANMINRLGKRITLSEDQITAIGELAKEFDFANLEAEEYKKIRKTFKDRIFAEVLTPEQVNKLNRN